PALLGLLALALAGVYLVTSGLHLAGRWSGLQVGTGVVIALRRALFDHLQRLPLAFFTRAQTGLIQNRVSNDVQEVNSLLTDTVSSAVNDLVSLAFTL